MKIKVHFVRGRNCWAIECDCQENHISAEAFINACQKHLTKEAFPGALWYHCRGSIKTSYQCVECYGPNAKKDAKDAAIILAGVISQKKSA